MRCISLNLSSWLDILLELLQNMLRVPLVCEFAIISKPNAPGP